MTGSTTTAGSGPVTLLIGTRKGAFTLKSDRTRRAWKVSPPRFLGHIIHHVVAEIEILRNPYVQVLPIILLRDEGGLG